MLVAYQKLDGGNQIEVDLLVGIGSACNLMSTALCKKLGLTLAPCSKKLVSFSSTASRTMGVTNLETKLGEWKQMLQSHVTAGEVKENVAISHNCRESGSKCCTST